MQYTVIFHGCKKDNFQMKNSDIFLVFAQNRLWVHIRTASLNDLCLRAKIRKKYTPVHPSFTIHVYEVRSKGV